MFGLNDNNQNNPSGPAQSAEEPTSAPPATFDDHSAPAEQTAPALPLEDPAPPASPPAPRDENYLISLKEQALSSLSPLVSHLEQTPEERFKTVMMLIQASDNSSLIKEAYETANQITDEKARAQALLDVINEINYFTQKDDKTKS